MPETPEGAGQCVNPKERSHSQSAPQLSRRCGREKVFQLPDLGRIGFDTTKEKLFHARQAWGSTALTQDVHSSDVEVLGRLQHVAIVRVDLPEAMLLGTGQVERVTRSEEDRAGKVADGSSSLLQKPGRYTKPLPHAAFLIFFEVSQDGRHLPASHMVLSDVPLEDRCKLQSRQLTRCQTVCAVGYFADSIRARFIEVALGDVRRVEVDHRSPRNSAWYTAESTGTFDRLRIVASRLGRGRPITEASNG